LRFGEILAPKPGRILAEQIAETLRELIDAGEYLPGVALRQDEVARRLGVSRIPVREAFRLLEADGMVAVHANRGAFVANPSVVEIEELMDTRLILECDLLRRSVPELTDAHLLHVDRLNDRIQTANSPDEWVRFDEEFHVATYAPARRQRTLNLVAALRRPLNAYYIRYMTPATRALSWRREHKAILAALHARDAAAAVEALSKHVADTRRALLHAMAQRPVSEQR
jgi:DNA-binding GntR family transcriptional regulator